MHMLKIDLYPAVSVKRNGNLIELLAVGFSFSFTDSSRKRPRQIHSNLETLVGCLNLDKLHRGSALLDVVNI